MSSKLKTLKLFGLYVLYLLLMTLVFQSQERHNEIKECKMAQDKVKKYKVILVNLRFRSAKGIYISIDSAKYIIYILLFKLAILQNDLVTSTFYQFGYHTRFCNVIKRHLRTGYLFTKNAFLYEGYINLTAKNCSQESIDNLRTMAVKMKLAREHITSKSIQWYNQNNIISIKYICKLLSALD